MALKVVLCILFGLLLGTSDGFQKTQFTNNYQDLSIKEQLKLLNKPAVKTVQTEDGDTYNCVDFYKQPAFDHPALKNHDFHPQMRPTSRPWQSSSVRNTPESSSASIVGLKEPCPYGTVPIRKVTENDLIRQRRVLMNTNNEGQYMVAIARTKSPSVYHGVGANITVHSPLLMDDEYTFSQIVLQGGSDTIKTGWTVNKGLYGDKKTRLFIYTEAGKSQCFNTHCPGFVIVRTDIPLAGYLTPISKEGETLYHFSYFITQDPVNGNWWLLLGHNYTEVGFWPNRIFTGLAQSGSYISCGGESFHPPPTGGQASIGSGYQPSRHKLFNSYCKNFFSIDDEYKIAVKADTEAYTTLPSEFGVRDEIILYASEFSGGEGINGTKIHIDREHRVTFGGEQIAQT